MAKFSRSVSSFLWVLVLAVLATALISGGLGYVVGSTDLGGEFSAEQVEFVDGLMYGTELKKDRELWLVQFKADKAAENDQRAFPGQRCAGKFFPDHPVAMKGCLLAQEPRPPKGYQYP